MRQVIKNFWIDESGDAGFKFDKGSSRVLVIVMIYSTDSDIVNGVENIVNELKSDLHLTKDYEFKFSRCKDKFRKAFFQKMRDLTIQYKAIVVDKKEIAAPALKFQPQQLYCELVRRLLYDNDPALEKATLILDEATAKIHHKEFDSVLKKYLSKNIVSKIKQKKSKNNTMIQVADMIAGAIFRKYEKRDDSYYQMIKTKEKILIEF